MENSFFGFDTSLPLDEDGGNGRIAEPSEEEYDALNDETFGSAMNGDWEEAHESLVRLTDTFSSETGSNADNSGLGNYGKKELSSSIASSRGSTPAHQTDCDLENYLSNMKLDDVDLSYDVESMRGGESVMMDPSVWSSQSIKSPMPSNLMGSFKSRTLYDGVNNAGENDIMRVNPTEFLRQHFPSPFQQFQQQPIQRPPMSSNISSAFNAPFLMNASPNSPKICTLEDIERNLIMQQSIQKQQQEQHNHHMQQTHQAEDYQPQQQILNEMMKHASNTPTPPQATKPHHPQVHKPQPTLPKGPPGFNTAQCSPRSGNNIAPPHHTNLAQPPQPNLTAPRMPPGFSVYPPGLAPPLQQQPPLPPHPLLNQHGLQGNFPLLQRQLPNSHLPIALNNFAMHPNFNAMRPPVIPPGMLAQSPLRGVHPLTHGAPLNQHQSNSMYNMFNMRLVQEIQQNHPLLQNAARQSQQQQQQHLQHQQQRNAILKQNHHRRDGANGNLPHEEFDEYANLMSTRDKHWLIGIQLSQLNTDTPYIDDFYYTVYRERKAVLSGVLGNSKAHTDNQLNHPLTQPKGHAQLILVQLGNKNGTRNGQHRDRSNSEMSGNSGIGQDQKLPYVFTPLKFENSLGKLQYGSVTAPRKIIDAEIMGNDMGMENNDKADSATLKSKNDNMSGGALHNSRNNMGDMTTSAQRKSRHILLHIETLYRILLKLEDLDNPNAIATIIIKKKKENERIAALEQLENASKTPEEQAAEASNPQSMNPALKSKFAYEIETKEALVAKLISGLTHDKIIAMMNVRKGKVLIKRIMPYINSNEEIRWNLWIGVFASLQNVIKKDRDDSEGLLYALYPDFRDQIKLANFEIVVKISESIPLKDKKSNSVFCSKFGISSLVCLIIQAERVYEAETDKTLTDTYKKNWCNFLNHLATSLNHTIQNQTICAAIEPDSIQHMMDHFARFKDLKLDSLLALTTQAKKQIN